jgi:hypothetical protein
MDFKAKLYSAYVGGVQVRECGSRLSEREEHVASVSARYYDEDTN